MSENGGQLQWEPPQVGTSVRASALGEFVLFTKEGLVIHGPPLAASRLYMQSFIGTKILLGGARP